MLPAASAQPHAPLLPGLLPAVLAVSLSAVHVVRPLYGPDGAVIVDFALEYLNPAGRRLTGLPERPGGSALTPFPHPLAPGLLDYYRRAFAAAGELVTYEADYRADERLRTLRFAAQRHDDVLVVSLADATSPESPPGEHHLPESPTHKQEAQERAQERQNLLRLFEYAPVAVALLREPDHRIDYFNERFAQFYPGAQRGLTIREAYPATVTPEVIGHLDQVYQTGRLYRGAEAPLPSSPPDDPRYITFTYQAYYEQGRVAGVAVFVYDVTDQVRARQQREAQQQEMQRILEQAPVAIAILRGPELVLELVNAEMCAIWGRPASELVGRPNFEAVPETAGQGFEEILAGVLTTGQPFVINERVATINRAHTGLPVTGHFNFVFQPLFDDHGTVTGVIAVGTEVTEQVLARQIEEANAQQLKLITDAVPVLIGYLDREERYRFTNEAYRAWFNRDPQELLGQHVRDIVGDAAYQNAKPYIDRALAGERLDFEALMPYREDFVKYIRTSFVPDVQEGELRGFYSLVMDITEEVRVRQQIEQAKQALEVRVQERTHEAQQARAEAERQRGELERVFAQAPVAIAVYRGPNYVIELANPTVCRLWGRRQQDIIGKGLFEALPEVAGMGYEELLDRVMSTGIPYVAHAMEAVHEREGRRDTVYWDFVYVPMYGADDLIYGAMVVATEATEQVLAQRRMEQINQELEIRVRERTRQLTEQQSLLSQILRLVPASIATLSGPQHRYSFFNELYQQLSANRTALGLTVAEVFPEVVEQGFVSLLDRVYATGDPFVGTDTPALLHDPVTGQPEQRYVDFLYQPLTDDRQQVHGILAFILDVTDKALARQQVQRLNDELLATNQQLTRTNVDLDTFVYTASHDLRAPISNIEGLLEALREGLAAAPLADEVKQLLAMMQNNVERFNQTITHLSDIAQLQRADNEPFSPVPLAEVIDDVRLDLEPRYLAAGARLLVDVADCPTVAFSRRHMRSVLYNLLSNAEKYRDPLRPPVVRVACRLEAEYAVLTVEDNGLGLTAAQQGQLFGLFRRLHNHVEGTGIGLYTVKRIVENAGGHIGVRSQPGVGTTFSVYFRR